MYAHWKQRHVIEGGIEKHLKNNTVISYTQHWLMRSKSCFSQLISVYDKVTHLADQGKPVDVIFLDFSKAFDVVSPMILLDKMSSTQLDKHITWKLIDFPLQFYLDVSPQIDRRSLGRELAKMLEKAASTTTAFKLLLAYNFRKE
ncbi:rna-directed dna polymerase from mobile element jockey-like [Willisornis vidua]|uniref:Rna-directed dna polymerase from mobile element jockey-like n=1 Tax=Willisornis vidua TaxID=1566151 RepID=A0ABQ9DQL7_9PASS|nr:rna-directed dna polymerase from mobile element jockey-like [Willisornis vidua]